MTDQFTIKKLERVLAELKSQEPTQLTNGDLETMTPTEINTARRAGQLSDLLTNKTTDKD